MTKKKKVYYTILEVAEALGRTRQAINARIKAGTVKAERFGSVHLIPASEFQRLKSEPLAAGRPFGSDKRRSGLK